jgi:hypothetical protein
MLLTSLLSEARWHLDGAPLCQIKGERFRAGSNASGERRNIRYKTRKATRHDRRVRYPRLRPCSALLAPPIALTRSLPRLSNTPPAHMYHLNRYWLALDFFKLDIRDSLCVPFSNSTYLLNLVPTSISLAFAFCVVERFLAIVQSSRI